MQRIIAAVLLVAGLPLAASALDVVRVGVSTPLTGPAATYGADIKRSFLFLNREFGGGRFELLFEDDRCDGKEAVTVARKLADVDKVKVVTGFACSGALLSALPIYERSGIITVGVSTSSPALSGAGAHLFRTCPSDRIALPAMYQHLLHQKGSVAAMFEETDFAQDYRKALEEANRDAKLKLFVESYPSTETDFRTMLIRLRSHEPQGMLIVSQSEEPLIRIVRQLHELGWHGALYGHAYPSSPTFLAAAGSLAEGMVFTDLPTGEAMLTSAGRAAYAKFVATEGELKSGSYYFALTAAAFSALLTSYDQGGLDAERLHRGDFGPPLMQPFHFTAGGDISGDSYTFVLKIIHDGKVHLLGE